jgi:DASS family divalent anion:Na+ symporter
MTAVYQGDVIACAMFLTGQASNALIAKFAADVAGVELSYTRWLIGGLVPGVVSLVVVPLVIYRLFPPEVRHTPGAAAFARDELVRLGRMQRGEWIMLLTFVLIAGLWMTTGLHHINYAVVALAGICTLLLANVLTWDDVLGERSAWDVFIWYGGLVQMAAALGDTGITSAALAVLLLVYFYAHYAFASITAHATAMYVPFLVVTLAAGAPPMLAVLSLAYFSNLDAALTHYGTTPAPIYFGARYVTQREWWKHGFIASVVTITIWSTIGFAWWKMLGWW